MYLLIENREKKYRGFAEMIYEREARDIRNKVNCSIGRWIAYTICERGGLRKKSNERIKLVRGLSAFRPEWANALDKFHLIFIMNLNM